MMNEMNEILNTILAQYPMLGTILIILMVPVYLVFLAILNTIYCFVLSLFFRKHKCPTPAKFMHYFSVLVITWLLIYKIITYLIWIH